MVTLRPFSLHLPLCSTLLTYKKTLLLINTVNPPFDSHFLPPDARDHQNKGSSNQISNCQQNHSNVICNNCGVKVHLPFVTSRFANVEIIHTVETIPAVNTIQCTLNGAVTAVTAYAAIRVSTVVCYMNGDIGVSTSISRNVACCTRLL